MIKKIKKIILYFNKIYKDSNILGFILSILLIIISFYLVHKNNIYKNQLKIILIIFAIIQIIIHLIYFIKLNFFKFDTNLNIISFLFTITIIFILITGSLWIMSHLNKNLM